MINPSHATGLESDLFLYPLKTSENQRFSDVFRGYKKRSVAWNGLIKILEFNMIKSVYISYISTFLASGLFPYPLKT